MAVKPEVKKADVEAKIKKLKEKGVAASLPPVERKPYDPENALLSKAEFIKKWAARDEEKAMAKEYVSRKRAEVTEDEPTHPAVMETPKRGRKKKVED